MLPRRSGLWIAGRGIAIVLLSGFVGASLVRLAPGFGADARVLDPRLSAESLRAIELQHAAERNPLTFYVRYLSGLLSGDAGRSVVFGAPVGAIIRERAPTTIYAVCMGLAIGWSVAMLLATVIALTGSAAAAVGAMTLSGSLLSIPSAVLATLCLLLRQSPAIALGAVIFPRVFPYVHAEIRSSLAAPHVVMARARGLSRAHLFLFHIVPATLPPLIALLGVSVTLAFGASIPIEALADSPGIGQLAWRAALGRDLPVLVAITLLLTAITVMANVLADLVIARFGVRAT